MDNETMQDARDRENMGGIGYLVVRVSTANGAIPLSGARVSVRGGEESNSDYFRTLYTGASGLTEKIELSAPSKALAQGPMQNGAQKPYALYSIDVFYDGYSDLLFANVPIFDTITSIQPANMIPKPDNEYSDNFAPYDARISESEAPEL